MIEKPTTLETLIAEAKARPPMTEAEWAAQRASFARAEVGFGSDRDEAHYRRAVASGDREEIARLNQEAEDRVKRAFR
jgi:hypothetical protein